MAAPSCPGCRERDALLASALERIAALERRGWAQRWGGPIEKIRPGDVIWFPPGEKHWHGKFVVGALTHLWELRDLPIPRHSLQESHA